MASSKRRTVPLNLPRTVWDEFSGLILSLRFVENRNLIS